MNFWNVHEHGWIFLLGMVFFPRITMLFFTAVTFGFWAWVGWVLTPYLLAAIYATTCYWHTNPVICVIAWLMVAGGTGKDVKLLDWLLS